MSSIGGSPGKATASLSQEHVRKQIQELGPWFHNIDLGGVQTAPAHFLGDYPGSKWRRFQHAIPHDLRGKTVLDVGCNGGFDSVEMKRRGAAYVLAIDTDPAYLAQARFAAEMCGAEIEFRQMDVYSVPELGRKFDLVLFMGVLYHLRHPLLALDLLSEHCVKDLFVFQSHLRGSDIIAQPEPDYPFEAPGVFEQEGFPVLYFVEHSYAGDPTNWWIPNRACAEAMLRSAGFDVLENLTVDVHICRRSRHG